MRKFFKKRDILVIVIILIIALIGVISTYKNMSKKDTIANVQYDADSIVHIIKVDLDKPQTITIPTNSNVIIEVREDRSIGFTHSDCPDQICIKSGFLRRPNQTAACLPNKVIITIVADGENNDLPDIVV